MTMANIDSTFFFFSLLCHVNSHIDMSALGQAMVLVPAGNKGIMRANLHSTFLFIV